MNNFKKIKKIVKENETLYSFFKKIKTHHKKFKYSKYFNDATISNGQISHNDEMFLGDLEHYNKVGESAINNIIESLELANISVDKIKSILDLPCGHGRVMRQLIKYFDADKITGCDLDEDGVRFCNKEFGSIPLISNVNFNQINFDRKFNLIWVGSLFTHLDSDKFENLLQVLYNIMETNAVLVFTAHGSYSLEIFHQYPGINPPSMNEIKKKYDEGFYFIPYDGSIDYGISLTPEKAVYKIVEKASENNLVLLRFKHRGWDEHQDVYSYKKIK